MKNINNPERQNRVLVAALDWGLGHATRCIPIINSLKNEGITVYLAGEKEAVKIFEEAFPGTVILPLKGYRVRYSKSKLAFLPMMFFQIPKISIAIIREHFWLKRMVKTYKINRVISDNRYGLFHKEIESVLITHQVNIETRNSFLNKIANSINHFFIRKFNRLWIPDLPGSFNLAGKLSHPEKMPSILFNYLGVLSRFIPVSTAKKFDLMILLSGPEPMRSIFEEMLLQELSTFKGTVIFVRGLPLAKKSLQLGNGQEVFNHLPAELLSMMIQQSELVIARSGYSTVMDLIRLKKKAILVPTPGQAEQEYLAIHLKKIGLFHTCLQESFSLNNCINEAKEMNFVYRLPGDNYLLPVIKELLSSKVTVDMK